AGLIAPFRCDPVIPAHAGIRQLSESPGLRQRGGDDLDRKNETPALAGVFCCRLRGAQGLRGSAAQAVAAFASQRSSCSVTAVLENEQLS
ncbi:hypothetical protein NYZ21_21270, partial [Acinetobacter baumannii]|nr:hypothetical protein [Acinetobacter baumannii]